MKIKRINLTLILLLITTVTAFTFNTEQAQCFNDNIYSRNFKIGTVFRYNFNYSGTEYMGFSSLQWVEFTVNNLLNNSLIVEYFDSNSFGSPSLREIYPEETLRFLPFGVDEVNPILPDIEEVITPILISSTNWTKNGISWSENTALSIATPVHNIHYKFNNIWTDAHIFSGIVQQYQFSNRFIYGSFNATYSTKSGILLELNWDMVNQLNDNTIVFNMVLEESTVGIGWSFIYKDVVIFSSIFGVQWVYSALLFAVIYIKRDSEIRKELEEEKEEEVEITDSEVDPKPKEEPIKAPKNIPEDYDFIYYCPFCNAELKEYQNVCPECGGKR